MQSDKQYGVALGLRHEFWGSTHELPGCKGALSRKKAADDRETFLSDLTAEGNEGAGIFSMGAEGGGENGENKMWGNERSGR